MDTVEEKIHKNHELYINSKGDLLRKTIYDMQIISTNMVYPGGIIKQLDEYLMINDPIEKNKYKRIFESQLIEYVFNNRSIGVVSYYDPRTNSPIVSSEILMNCDEINKFQSFFNTKIANFQIPHGTVSSRSRYDVLSLTRNAGSYYNSDIIVYIETDEKFIKNLLKPEEDYKGMIIGIIDKTGNIVCTSDNSIFPTGSNYFDIKEELKPTLTKGYYFIEYNADEWKIIGMIKSINYINEYLRVIREFVVVFFIFIIIYIILACVLWHMMYNPIENFVHELKNVNKWQLYKLNLSGAKEFDKLSNILIEMRLQIGRLLSQVENEVKRSTSLENELLLSRINPHFLYNMLSNIKWLAMKNKQAEIPSLIVALKNLLYYNLGKNKIATLRDEIQAVDDYLLLQRYIYKFEYKKHINVPEKILEMKFPRFILQPIVENSIKHGYTENLIIRLYMDYGVDYIIIKVEDNGLGMDEYKLKMLNESENIENNTFIGIGLKYVIKSLTQMFGHMASVIIKSSLHNGTKVVLKIKTDNKRGEKND